MSIPYYVYMHDSGQAASKICVRPYKPRSTSRRPYAARRPVSTRRSFICDAPGGGGKRDIHSYEYYDRENGISVWTAPSVKPGAFFLYYDPIDTLGPAARGRWSVPELQDRMIDEALARAGGTRTALA